MNLPVERSFGNAQSLKEPQSATDLPATISAFHQACAGCSPAALPSSRKRLPSGTIPVMLNDRLRKLPQRRSAFRNDQAALHRCCYATPTDPSISLANPGSLDDPSRDAPTGGGPARGETGTGNGDAGYASVYIEGVPHVRQKPHFCGEACAAMYLRRLGQPVDQNYVFDQRRQRPTGSSTTKTRGRTTPRPVTSVTIWRKRDCCGRSTASSSPVMKTIRAAIRRFKRSSAATIWKRFRRIGSSSCSS